MNTKDQPAQASGDGVYVLRKRGFFYRVNNMGYTSEIQDAHRYTKEEAETQKNGRPEVTIHLASDYAPAQASGDSEEAVREAIEELDRRIENAVGVRFHALTEARDLLRPTPALRPTPDHAAVVEALELCIDVMTWEHRQRDPKFKPEDATPESAIGRARTALSTMSKAPQAGGGQ